MADPTLNAQEDFSSYMEEMEKAIKPSWINIVRHHLRDYAGKNPLLGFKEEFTDEDIRAAIASGLSMLDSVPPSAIILSKPGSHVPRELFVGYTQVALLRMSLFGRIRNALPSSDGGVAIDEAKIAAYSNMLDRMQSSLDRIATPFKQSINVRGARGIIPSGYWLTYIIL